MNSDGLSKNLNINIEWKGGKDMQTVWAAELTEWQGEYNRAPRVQTAVMRHLFNLLLISVGISGIQSKARFRHYFFVSDPKNWTEAQSYCKEEYTDLATIDNESDIQRMISDNRTIRSWVWIGLQREDTSSSQSGQDSASSQVGAWRWSDGSAWSFKKWSRGEPSSIDEKCVEAKFTVEIQGQWNDNRCEKPHPFLCHLNDNGIPTILIRQNKTWEEALDYCREKHDDLVSIHNKDMQKLVQKRAEEADSPHVWLGLRYTCTLDFWFWVSDEPFCYQNWAPGSETGDCEKSGAMEKGGMHHWFSLPDTGRFNFICSCGDTGGCTDDE